jgi:hypothetical protein
MELNNMSFFIFQKNMDNLKGSLYKIAETEDYLNNMHIDKLNYKIIEVSQQNFNFVKLNEKSVEKYVGENIIYNDIIDIFFDETPLRNYINNFKKLINEYLINNKNHSLFTMWNNYYNQLNNLELNFLTFPKTLNSNSPTVYGLNKSLEKYFSDLGQTSLNPLQIP